MNEEQGSFAWADTGGGWCRVLGPGARPGEVNVCFWFGPALEREQSLPRARVAIAPLPAQTRVFLETPQGWRAGRVLDRAPGGEYIVSVRHQEEMVVPGAQLFVRCLDARPDPAGVLVIRATEGQSLHERRRAAMTALIEARNATAGVAGLASASVVLLKHQVAAVRRILLDPTQRYLLADEVGMGKTIEACAVVRQCLIDDRRAIADIVAPRHLVSQWQQELLERFDGRSFGPRLRVRSVDELDTVLGEESSILVLDEAHHIVADAPLGSSMYERLKDRAHSTPRLLLLSATPVLGNEDATLAMLHLLDPVAHPLGERESFAEKVKLRSEYGRLIVRLRPGGAFLDRAVRAALERFPEDTDVAECARRIREAMEGGDDAARDVGLRQLAGHIASTYRLHHRIVRNRRSTHPELFPPRTAWFESFGWRGTELDRLAEALADWQEAAERWAGDNETRAIRVGRVMADWCSALAACADTVPTVPAIGFPEEELLRKAIFKRVSENADELIEAQTAAVMKARNALRLALGPVPVARIVVFASSPRVAERVSRNLRAEGLHAKNGMTAVEHAAIYTEFERAASDRTLVCEPLAEEGANLQFAHGVVHADVPFDPGRVEQRVGRLDRIGRLETGVRQAFVHPLTADPALDYWTPWVGLLCDAFGVRHRSLSDTQFVLDALMEPIHKELARGNPGGLSELLEEIVKQLDGERERLDDQYALDEMWADDDATSAAWDRLQVWEARADHDLSRAMHRWMGTDLKLTINRTQNANCFRVQWSDRHVRMPRIPWQSALEPGLDREVTFSRRDAVRTPGAALLRPGHPLVDEIDRFTRWDDRGSVFATLRPVPNTPGVGRFFRLCFVVEADREVLKTANLEGPALAAAIRQADWRLPPRFIVQHVRYRSINEVSHPGLLHVLERSFTHARGDLDLGGPAASRWGELVDLDEFADRVRTVREVAEQRLRDSPVYTDVLDGVALATRELDTATALISARLRALGTHDPGLENELVANEAIRLAIARPSVWLDAIGFMLLEGTQ